MVKIGEKSRPTSCIVSKSIQQNCIPNKKGKQKPVCEMHDDEIREMHDDDPYFLLFKFQTSTTFSTQSKTEQNKKWKKQES